MSLNTQTNKISGVINFPNSLTSNNDYKKFIDKFNSFCLSYSKEYYFIVHNRDVNDYGEFKTQHIHFLINTSGISDRKRLITHLNTIADSLNINTNLVSVSVWKDYEGLIQYLIHKNSPEKIAYNKNEIITNMNSAYLNTILERVVEDRITIEYLEMLINEGKSISTIYKLIGLKNSKLYRGIINDLIKDKYNIKIN